MALRDTLDKLTGRFHPTVNAACLDEKEITALRHLAGESFPGRCGWHLLRYPGEMTLPVFIVPLAPPLPEPVSAAVRELHAAMRREGFTEAQAQISSRYEKRQSHLWFAMLARGQYRPIGQATFLLEERTRTEEAPPDPAEPGALRLSERQLERIAHRWWLQHVWLSPAYRCQRIFRHSVPYFQEWHPNFLVRDPWAPLARALKEHPGHIFEGTVEWF